MLFACIVTLLSVEAEALTLPLEHPVQSILPCSGEAECDALEQQLLRNVRMIYDFIDHKVYRSTRFVLCRDNVLQVITDDYHFLSKHGISLRINSDLERKLQTVLEEAERAAGEERWGLSFGPLPHEHTSIYSRLFVSARSEKKRFAIIRTSNFGATPPAPAIDLHKMLKPFADIGNQVMHARSLKLYPMTEPDSRPHQWQPWPASQILPIKNMDPVTLKKAEWERLSAALRRSQPKSFNNDYMILAHPPGLKVPVALAIGLDGVVPRRLCDH
jgi:hypothetical protein